MRVLCLLLILAIPACNLSMDGLASTGTATTAAVLGSTVNPVVGVTAGVVAGVATDLVTEPAVQSPSDFGGEDMQINTFWELASFAIANFFNNLVAIGIIIAVVWFLTGYLGARKRRPEEKMLEKQVAMLVDKIGTMKDK